MSGNLGVTGSVASRTVEVVAGEHLKTLRRCDGYYGCPRNPEGKRLGPLVGYAGKYDDEHHWVGDVYYNFARAERFHHVADAFARDLAAKIREQQIKLDCILAAPMGGIVLGAALARQLDIEFVFAEKKVTAAATAGSREESVLVLDRHEITPGWSVGLFEDVCNNFSTTGKAEKLVADAGAKFVAITCILNRSSEVSWATVPVMSLLHIPTLQYHQDDPEVAADIAAGNVVWKPKNNWRQLKAAMAAVQQ